MSTQDHTRDINLSLEMAKDCIDLVLKNASSMNDSEISQHLARAGQWSLEKAKTVMHPSDKCIRMVKEVMDGQEEEK